MPSSQSNSPSHTNDAGMQSSDELQRNSLTLLHTAASAGTLAAVFCSAHKQNNSISTLPTATAYRQQYLLVLPGIHFLQTFTVVLPHAVFVSNFCCQHKTLYIIYM